MVHIRDNILKRNLTVSCLGKCTNWSKAIGIAFSGMGSKGVRNTHNNMSSTSAEQLTQFWNPYSHQGKEDSQQGKGRQPTLIDQSQNIGFHRNDGNLGFSGFQEVRGTLASSYNNMNHCAETSNMSQHLERETCL